MRRVSVGDVVIANDLPIVLIAGPCQIENRDHSLMIAERLQAMASAEGIGFVFKSSFDKANRTSIGGKRGPGLADGLSVLSDVKKAIGCPVLTDVHTPSQCTEAAEVVDMLQIPACLCRQPDLLVAAGETGAAINVKKGQFMAPADMTYAAEKIASTGNHRILLCERGVCFGYNALVADIRSLPIMASTGYPVVIDATHSVQQPGGKSGSSGGQREFAPVIARAAAAVGVAAAFIEVHDNPDAAPSDGPNMIRLDEFAAILRVLAKIDRVAKSDPVRI